MTKVIRSTALALLLTVSTQGSIDSYSEKEYYGTTINSNDGLGIGGRNYFHGAQGAASVTWGDEIEGNTIVCYGGLSCANPSFESLDTTTSKTWVADGAFSAINLDNSNGNGDECLGNGYMSCAGISSSDGSDGKFNTFRCYGLGSCAYRKVQHYNSGSNIYDRLYTTLAGYNSEWTTDGSGSISYYLYTRGTFASYGAIFYCSGSDTCYVDCNDGPFSCYNLEYNCDSSATCYLSGCDSSNKLYCPTLTGDGTIINSDGLSESAYNYDITSDSNYDSIEEFASYLINNFLLTSNDISSIDINNYYDDLCYFNCANGNDGNNEDLVSLGTERFVEDDTSCTVNDDSESGHICFTGEETGRYSDFDWSVDTTTRNLYVDGDDSADTTTFINLGSLSKIYCRSDQSCQTMIIDGGGSELNCMGADSCMWAETTEVPTIRSFTWETGYDGQFDNVQVVMSLDYASFDYADFTTPNNENDVYLIISGGWAIYGGTFHCQSSDICHIYWYGTLEYSQDTESTTGLDFTCDGTCIFYDNDYSWISADVISSSISGSRTGSSSSSSSSDNSSNTDNNLVIWLSICIGLLVIIIIIGGVIYYRKNKNSYNNKNGNSMNDGLLDNDAQNTKPYEPVKMNDTNNGNNSEMVTTDNNNAATNDNNAVNETTAGAV